MKFHRLFTLVALTGLCALLIGVCRHMGYAQPANKDQALLEAALNLDVQAVDTLLKQQANLNVINPKSNYPVLIDVCRINLAAQYEDMQEVWQARKKKRDVIKLLVKAGARLDVSTGGRYTPLLLLAERSYYPKNYSEEWSMESLFVNPTQKPNVNWRAYYDWTALMLAVKVQDYGHVQFLLSKRADPNIVNNNGDTALDLAYKTPALNGDNVHGNIIQILQENRAKTGKELRDRR